jgi:hypothetical protein
MSLSSPKLDYKQLYSIFSANGENNFIEDEEDDLSEESDGEDTKPPPLEKKPKLETTPVKNELVPPLSPLPLPK